MDGFRTFALFLTTMAVIAFNSLSLDAQATTSARQSASIVPSIVLQKDEILVGQPVWVILTVKNITSHEIPLATDMLDYRIHVESEKNEPPKTAYHRRLRGEFLPGETELAGGGVVLSIPPGNSGTRKYDLENFYDLKVPGKYKVYIEVRDESSDTWIRTNTTQFEMQATTP